jgi:hypothetical protein
MNIRRRALNAMNQPQRLIYADMHFHTEMPLVALFSLVHFRVSRAGAVLRRRWRTNDRGIDNAAFTHSQPLLSKMLIYRIENLFSQVVFFQKVTEIQDRGFPVCQPDPIQLQFGITYISG